MAKPTADAGPRSYSGATPRLSVGLRVAVQTTWNLLPNQVGVVERSLFETDFQSTSFNDPCYTRHVLDEVKK